MDPYRGETPPGMGHWLLEPPTDGHEPDSAALLLADRMIWFDGDEENWKALGLERPERGKGYRLAREIQKRPMREQVEALETLLAALAKRLEDKWSWTSAVAFSRDHVRAYLEAATGSDTIQLIERPLEKHGIRVDAASRAVLEEWCAWNPPRPIDVPIDVELLHIPVERRETSLWRSLFGKKPRGEIVVGSRMIAWRGWSERDRVIALHDDVRKVIPDGFRLRFADAGAIASVRRMLATPLFQRAMQPQPFMGRLVRTVEKYLSLDARGTFDPEYAACMLDDKLVLFRGDDRNWNAAADMRGDWVDERASTLAALLRWLPEHEQLAAVRRLVEACEYRFHMLTEIPRDEAARRIRAAPTPDRIPLRDDADNEHYDLQPTPAEYDALAAWAR